ncbi:Zinc finger protein, partial [Pseudolycoriella hygida]
LGLTKRHVSFVFYKILDSLKIPNDSDEEPCLSKKIECVVGIKVRRNDQMPQYICTLCVDKINDFFEYREMCGATNIQTRKLLGMPLESMKRKKFVNDKEIKAEGESILGLGIEDEDNTDSKLSVKLAKHRVKGRPKKKGNSSKKKVMFKDDEVKLEEEEIKVEAPAVKINHKGITKRLKIDLKKRVEEAPLLTLKEPNKRERRREIDAQKLERRRFREEQRREIEEKKREIELAKQILEQKKLEKKRKRKGTEPELPIKKLKQEVEVELTPLHSCLICTKAFVTSDMLSSHLQQSHTVTISSFGCSSCAESFKTHNEEKDHELWHSLSKTSYICPICNVAFDKTSIFTRHITLCKPFDLTPTVTNIRCSKCSEEFLTQNLYQWHKCFVKPNGRCWHCNRIFVKASTLFKHSFKCNQSTNSSHIEPAPKVSTEPKKRRTSRTCERESHIKSEPEANLDMDVAPTHVLTSDMLPSRLL